MDMINSRENPGIVQYVRLRDKRGLRLEESAFVTEGHKLTQEALEAGCGLRRIYVTKEAAARYSGVYEGAILVGDSVGKKMQAGQSGQGVFAVFDLPDLPRPSIWSGGRYIVLWNMQDPGNLGTILRSASAFGMDGVVLTGNCADVWNLKTLRASMGGVFRVPFLLITDLEEAVSQLQSAGVRVLAATLDEEAATLSPGQLSGGGRAVVIGNEGQGLPDWGISICHGGVRLPMRKGVESLNAAAAATIFSWELSR